MRSSSAPSAGARQLPLREPARAVGLRVLAIVAGAVAVSPVALARLPLWYDYINGEEVQLSAIPGWNLAFDNGLGWAFGLLHLHELGEFDDLALPLKVLAVAIPLALVATVILGGACPGARAAPCWSWRRSASPCS